MCHVLVYMNLEPSLMFLVLIMGNRFDFKNNSNSATFLIRVLTASTLNELVTLGFDICFALRCEPLHLT